MDIKLNGLFTTASQAGLKSEELQQTCKVRKNVTRRLADEPVNYHWTLFTVLLLAFLIVVASPQDELSGPLEFIKRMVKDYLYLSGSDCLFYHTSWTIELTRPVQKCTECKGINEIPVIYNMTKEYFMKHHAYTGIPVLVKNGASNWTALKIFGYRYFKVLYSKLNMIDYFDEMGCQFFSYKTNIFTLRDLLTMSKKRANLEEDLWYVGWSNCFKRTQAILRKHYQRPAFLPDDSESSKLDWIFMGGSGIGAQMHIDSVMRPSWQAMIKGKKTWFLAPTPECEMVCAKRFNVTLEPGDILVVNTNIWYHSTTIHPGNLSITIGSEYD